MKSSDTAPPPSGALPAAGAEPGDIHKPPTAAPPEPGSPAPESPGSAFSSTAEGRLPLVPQAGPHGRTPPDPETAWPLLLTKTCLPFRNAGRRTAQRVRDRLEMDPVYRLIVERGWLPPRGRYIEIGPEVGVFASLLYATHSAERHGLWPADWKRAPSARLYLGVQAPGAPAADVVSALSALPSRPRLVAGDLQALELPRCDVVLMLDALRRVERKVQRVPLEAARRALRPGGRLLLRVQEAGGYRGDRVGAWSRDLIAWLRGEQWPAGCNRPLGEWKVLLWRMGFNVEAVPLDWGLETGEVLLVCTLLKPV